MPSRSQFATREEYNAAILEWKRKNPENAKAIKQRADQKSGFKYQRNWQKTHPERERARGAVRRAIAKGTIIKQPFHYGGENANRGAAQSEGRNT